MRTIPGVISIATKALYQAFESQAHAGRRFEGAQQDE
jgi:hypothetical protein